MKRVRKIREFERAKMQEIGICLRKTRTEFGLTIGILSQKVSCARAYIESCEKGRLTPSIKYLIKLQTIFQQDAMWPDKILKMRYEARLKDDSNTTHQSTDMKSIYDNLKALKKMIDVLKSQFEHLVADNSTKRFDNLDHAGPI